MRPIGSLSGGATSLLTARRHAYSGSTRRPVQRRCSLGPASEDIIGGKSGRATVALAIPAPTGGGVVNLTDNPSVIHVPANVTIAAGNSTNTFTIGTDSVSGLSTEETLSQVWAGSRYQFLSM